MKKLSSVLAIILAFVGCARATDISIHGMITVNDDQRFGLNS